MNTPIYSQKELDAIKAQAHLQGMLDMMKGLDPTSGELTKITIVAKALRDALHVYGPHLPSPVGPLLKELDLLLERHGVPAA